MLLKVFRQMQQQGHNQNNNSNINVFMACSAFEYGGDVHCVHKEEENPGNIHSCITALKYPIKVPRHYCAKPFENAVVRLTRESLSIYRPTDRIFHCELKWCDVREIRRHTSKKGNKTLYEFAFIMRSAIIVLEVSDAMTADGIAASMHILNTDLIVPLTPSPPLVTSPTTKTNKTTPTPTTRSKTISAISHGNIFSRPLSVSSARSYSSASLLQGNNILLQREEQRGAALQRIRQREEEMREAIFYIPHSHSRATSSRGEAWGSPTTSSSPAPRRQSLPLQQQQQQQQRVNIGNSVEIMNTLSRPMSKSMSVGRPRIDEVENTTEMQNILRLLEQEEEKASKSLKSQEERIRTLCFKEEVYEPKTYYEKETSINNSVLRNEFRQQVLFEKKIKEEENPKHSIGNESNVHSSVVKEVLKPPLRTDCKQDKELQEPKQEQSKRKEEHQILEAKIEVESKVPLLSILETSEKESMKNRELNETRRLESQLKAEKQKQRISIGGLSLSDALQREKETEQSIRQEEESLKPQPILDTNINTNDNTVIKSSQDEKFETRASSIIYGNWKELNHKETGKTYYRNIITKEAVWKTPPEVLKIKQEKEKEQQPHKKKENVEEGDISKTKKGPLRVSGVWKEFKDPKSGRLYYVNSETKQRTWKLEETPFTSE